MATTYISWSAAEDFAAYKIARSLATARGDTLRVGSAEDPTPPDTPTEHTHVLIAPREAESPQRWKEALAKAQRLGQQPFVTAEGGNHWPGRIS